MADAIETCAVKGCGKPGPWYPVLELRAPYEYRNSTVAPAALGLPHCEEHRETTTLETLLTDGAWAHVCAMMDAIGRAIPERDRTSLRWVTGDDPGVQALRAPRG